MSALLNQERKFDKGRTFDEQRFRTAMADAITKVQFERLRLDGGSRRICFATTHTTALKRSGTQYVGAFNVPFLESVGRLFEADCRLELFRNYQEFGGFWRSVRTQEEYQIIEAWLKHQGMRVFLRDCLDFSMALGANLVEDGSRRTSLGDTEARAKNDRDEAATNKLVELLCGAISDINFLSSVDLVVAVPPRPGKPFDLPSTLAQRIASVRSIKDLTKSFRFEREKRTIKDAEVDKKWDAWQECGLSFGPRLVEKPAVILVDDKYQSGTTINFVGSVLRAAGAGPIYGLCAVKTRRDTDNA